MQNKSATQLINNSYKDIEKYSTERKPFYPRFSRGLTHISPICKPLKFSNSILELKEKIEGVENLVKRKFSKPDSLTQASRGETDFNKEVTSNINELENNNQLYVPKDLQSIYRKRSEELFKTYKEIYIDKSFKFQQPKNIHQESPKKIGRKIQETQQIADINNPISPSHFLISVTPPTQCFMPTTHISDSLHYKSQTDLDSVIRNDSPNVKVSKRLFKEINDQNREQKNSINTFKDSPIKNISQKNFRPQRLNKSRLINIKDCSSTDSQQGKPISVAFPPQSPKLNTTIIQGFKFGRVIGKGKFGEVYLAKHIETSFLVAIKKVSKLKLKEFNMVDQFIKEVKLHCSLDHPKIVKFYGFFEQRQHFYLVIQYMNGGTLFDYINKVGTLGVRQAVDFLRDVIEALIYLHRRSIAHRDIKPENIVLSGGLAKLCDFGWSVHVESTRKTFCGTLDYVSPQILERKQYDWSVDIWCLGILTYELFLGRAPFQDSDRNTVIKRIVNVDIMGIPYTSKLTQQARQFIEALLQKNPSNRPKITQLLNFSLFANNIAKRRDLTKR